jgi:hypothetical protein
MNLDDIASQFDSIFSDLGSPSPASATSFQHPLVVDEDAILDDILTKYEATAQTTATSTPEQPPPTNGVPVQMSFNGDSVTLVIENESTVVSALRRDCYDKLKDFLPAGTQAADLVLSLEGQELRPRSTIGQVLGPKRTARIDVDLSVASKAKLVPGI